MSGSAGLDHAEGLDQDEGVDHAEGRDHAEETPYVSWLRQVEFYLKIWA